MRLLMRLAVCLNLVMLLAFTSSAHANDRLALAVSYFENTSKDKSLDPLSRGLAEMLITDLSTSSLITVVERSRLNDVLKEINLQKSPFFDEKSAAKLGKGLGAALIVTGSYLKVGDVLRIDARVIQVDDGTVALGVKTEGKVDNFLGMQRTLAVKLLEGIGDKVSLVARTKLSCGGTKSYDAFLSYSGALSLLDSGDKAAAAEALKKAATVDPDFKIAKEMQARVEKLLRSYDISQLSAQMSIAAEFLVGAQCECNHLPSDEADTESAAPRSSRRVWPSALNTPLEGGGNTGMPGLVTRYAQMDSFIELGLLDEGAQFIDAALESKGFTRVQSRDLTLSQRCTTDGPMTQGRSDACEWAVETWLKDRESAYLKHQIQEIFSRWVNTAIELGSRPALEKVIAILSKHKIPGNGSYSPSPNLMLPSLKVLVSDQMSPCLKAAVDPVETLRSQRERKDGSQIWSIYRGEVAHRIVCFALEAPKAVTARGATKGPPPLYGPSLREQVALREAGRAAWSRVSSGDKVIPGLPEAKTRWAGLDLSSYSFRWPELTKSIWDPLAVGHSQGLADLVTLACGTPECRARIMEWFTKGVPRAKFENSSALRDAFTKKMHELKDGDASVADAASRAIGAAAANSFKWILTKRSGHPERTKRCWAESSDRFFEKMVPHREAFSQLKTSIEPMREELKRIKEASSRSEDPESFLKTVSEGKEHLEQIRLKYAQFAQLAEGLRVMIDPLNLTDPMVRPKALQRIEDAAVTGQEYEAQRHHTTLLLGQISGLAKSLIKLSSHHEALEALEVRREQAEERGDVKAQISALEAVLKKVDAYLNGLDVFVGEVFKLLGSPGELPDEPTELAERAVQECKTACSVLAVSFGRLCERGCVAEGKLAVAAIWSPSKYAQNASIQQQLNYRPHRQFGYRLRRRTGRSTFLKDLREELDELRAEFEAARNIDGLSDAARASDRIQSACKTFNECNAGVDEGVKRASDALKQSNCKRILRQAKRALRPSRRKLKAFCRREGIRSRSGCAKEFQRRQAEQSPAVKTAPDVERCTRLKQAYTELTRSRSSSRRDCKEKHLTDRCSEARRAQNKQRSAVQAIERLDARGLLNKSKTTLDRLFKILKQGSHYDDLRGDLKSLKNSDMKNLVKVVGPELKRASVSRSGQFKIYCEARSLAQAPAYAELIRRMTLWRDAAFAFADGDTSQDREQLIKSARARFPENPLIESVIFYLRLNQGRIEDAKAILPTLPAALAERLKSEVSSAKSRLDGWQRVNAPPKLASAKETTRLSEVYAPMLLSKAALIAYLQLLFDDALKYITKLVQNSSGGSYAKMTYPQFDIDVPLVNAIRNATKDPKVAKSLKANSAARAVLAEKARAKLKDAPKAPICARICGPGICAGVRPCGAGAAKSE